MPLNSSLRSILPVRLLAVTATLLCNWVVIANAAPPLVPIPTVQTTAYDRGTGPADRDVPFLAWYEDLTSQGYLEEEIIMSGTANDYGYVDDLNKSPEPQTTGVSGSYKTRVLIRRPISAEKFNGVVYLEILNATAGYDGAPSWDMTHRSIIEEGAAWVGVTYSQFAADFMRDTWVNIDVPVPLDEEGLPLEEVPLYRQRYSEIDIASFAYTWDILNQAAALLKADNNSANPMQGFGVDVIIATGYSQSAGYVTTFANSFYPSYSSAAPCTAELAAADSCTPIVDGYIVAAGGARARKLGGVLSYGLGDQRNCQNSLNREAPCIETGVEPVSSDPYQHDLPKIIRFTTESDIDSVRVRQTMSDQPLLRTYEAAGTAHVGFWASLEGQVVREYQFGIPAGDDVDSPCILPFNPIRTRIPLAAIQYRLAQWIQFDEEPPASRYMVWQGDWNGKLDSFFNAPVSWVRDDGDDDFTDGDDGVGDGNAIGGIRPVTIGAPLGRYYGSNFYPPGPFSLDGVFCTGIFGGFDAYTPEELETRYFNRQAYLFSIWVSAWNSYKNGFLLVSDGRFLFDEARAFDGVPD